MREEAHVGNKNDITFILTNLMSQFMIDDMARLRDIVSGLSEQTMRKSAELAKERDELNKLRPDWQRFNELAKQIESKERMVKIGFGLLFGIPLKVREGDAYESPDASFEQESEALALDVADLDLSKYPLWRVIREVVRQTAEVRVFELEAHLKSFGLSASRPAIESALSTHPKEFRLTKRGREKFVSLK
jgi:hypothetical protein